MISGSNDLTLGVFDRDLDRSDDESIGARNYRQVFNPSYWPGPPRRQSTLRSGVTVPQAPLSNLPIKEISTTRTSQKYQTRQEARAGLDRSVSFSAHTALVSVLATPHLQPGQPRFLTQEGVTKQMDGLVGPPARRLHPVVDASVWDTSDVVEDDRDEEEDNVTVHHETEADETLSSYSTLNESKTPAPGSRFGSPDSAWNLPTPASRSTLPASVGKESQSQNLNTTIWSFDEETSVSAEIELNLARAVLGESEVYGLQEASLVRTTRQSMSSSTVGSLTALHSVAYSPRWHMFLVSEPENNRVGLYSGDTFKFDDWLIIPTVIHRHKVEAPSDLKTLKNGKQLVFSNYY